jgi:hypothetical protein
LLIAELETRAEQLRASEVDMKNLFYREKEAHVRTMCGSRTGGWSLPCVMSD